MELFVFELQRPSRRQRERSSAHPGSVCRLFRSIKLVSSERLSRSAPANPCDSRVSSHILLAWLAYLHHPPHQCRRGLRDGLASPPRVSPAAHLFDSVGATYPTVRAQPLSRLDAVEPARAAGPPAPSSPHSSRSTFFSTSTLQPLLPTLTSSPP